MSRTLRGAAAGAAALVLAGCGTGGPVGFTDDGRLTVVAGVYPLEWLATQVGGDDVAVEALTEPGAEPHDLELTPRQVGQVSEAGIALYIQGMQPAVDEAVEQQAADHGLDAAEVVELRKAGGEDGGTDPHMWLDPERMAVLAEALGDRLAEADPDNADSYRANAKTVAGELADIRAEYEDGLGDCSQRDFVVSHEAFGYLADAYDLNQIGVAGVEPDNEPSPARIGEVAKVVDEKGVDTIFTETLASPAVANTIAEETGATTAVLDPLEGITDRSPGDDYPSIMHANLGALSKALHCS
ncbi:zinc transport system substrate-binding protein [Murinocardiopsis flavida]|uniref:Zinc transport system substrate-binding protein n=1 Tax=Murinocardiopsis flavida TaxID=645275 RepID=A0A2P8D239_9ACTN|nr:metal ABC transporter substrate-binding protein [Murinocardiopsis flavida]PSK91282.1 zinc transport system substrate-binding protein [Murinocardiopsis flavida]